MKPSRFGPRVVKGRTPLQQQHAADYKTRPESVLNLLPSAFGLPSESWWANQSLTREQFAARVAQEQPRILGSKFARLSSIVRIEAAE
jgi:hypothetical protein